MLRAAVIVMMALQSLTSFAVYKWSDRGCYDITWYNASAQSYVISNAKQLAGVAYLVNNGYTTFAGKTITLAGNVDLSDRFWVPIGGEGFHFRGTFDGGYKEIKNIQIELNSWQPCTMAHG